MYNDATLRVFIVLLSMLLRGFFLCSNSNHRIDVKRHIISSKNCNAKHLWFFFFFFVITLNFVIHLPTKKTSKVICEKKIPKVSFKNCS